MKTSPSVACVSPRHLSAEIATRDPFNPLTYQGRARCPMRAGQVRAMIDLWVDHTVPNRTAKGCDCI